MLGVSFTMPAIAQENKATQQIGKGIYEIVIDPADNAVYVASVGDRNAGNAHIYKLDPNTLAATDSIHVEQSPFGLGFNRKTRTLYTSNTTSGSVYAIDVVSKKVLATISNGKEKSHTREIIVDEGNNLVYVSDVDKSGNIWVIDGKTNTYKYALEDLGVYATGLALDDKKQLLYYTLLGEGKVAGIDLKTKKKSFEVAIDTAASPINLVLDKEKNFLYVADSKKDKVYVIHTEDAKMVKTIDVGKYPVGIELDLKNNRIYTANREGKSVTVIDRNSLEAVKQVPTEGLSNTIKSNPVTGVTYVSNKQVSLVNRKGEPTGEQPLANGDSVSKIE